MGYAVRPAKSSSGINCSDISLYSSMRCSITASDGYVQDSGGREDVHEEPPPAVGLVDCAQTDEGNDAEGDSMRHRSPVEQKSDLDSSACSTVHELGEANEVLPQNPRFLAKTEEAGVLLVFLQFPRAGIFPIIEQSSSLQIPPSKLHQTPCTFVHGYCFSCESDVSSVT